MGVSHFRTYIMHMLLRQPSFVSQGVPVPDFELAFHQELGGHILMPSLDQMRILVARRKARPLFPEVWQPGDSMPAGDDGRFLGSGGRGQNHLVNSS